MNTLRVKKGVILKLGRGADNIHALSMRSQRSYQAVHDFATGIQKRLDLEVVSSILLSGLGMTQAEVLDLRIGDLLEFVPMNQDDPT